MFRLCILDVEEGVVGTGEGSAGLLVVLVRESIRGVGVSVLHRIGAGVWTLKLHMDQWSTCPYGKAGLSTGDLDSLAMSPVLALVVEHVEPMGLKGLWVVVTIMQVRCFFRPGISSIPSAFSMGGHPFRCHLLWGSLVYRCHFNLNQVILNNIEAKVWPNLSFIIV